MTVKDLLKELSEEEHSLLMYAFEQGIGQYIRLPGNRFIGVNVNHIKSLEIVEEINTWSVGYVRS